MAFVSIDVAQTSFQGDIIYTYIFWDIKTKFCIKEIM
jgi:hypothetical protein